MQVWGIYIIFLLDVIQDRVPLQVIPLIVQHMEHLLGSFGCGQQKIKRKKNREIWIC